MERRPGGELRFFTPRGRPLPEAPTVPVLSNRAAETLVERLVEDGVEIDAWTSCPSWAGERLDLAWALDCLRGRPEGEGGRAG